MRDHCPQVSFHQMGTGFTWDTQDRTADIAAAEKSWLEAEKLLSDASYHLVVLDELTYMLSFKYLDKERVLKALQNRPQEQSLVVTGRGGGSELSELADTVSEVKEIKHAYKAGIMAKKGSGLLIALSLSTEASSYISPVASHCDIGIYGCWDCVYSPK